MVWSSRPTKRKIETIKKQTPREIFISRKFVRVEKRKKKKQSVNAKRIDKDSQLLSPAHLNANNICLTSEFSVHFL